MYRVISHNYCIAMWENSIHTSGNDVQGNLSHNYCIAMWENSIHISGNDVQGNLS